MGQEEVLTTEPPLPMAVAGITVTTVTTTTTITTDTLRPHRLSTTAPALDTVSTTPQRRDTAGAEVVAVVVVVLDTVTTSHSKGGPLTTEQVGAVALKCFGRRK